MHCRGTRCGLHSRSTMTERTIRQAVTEICRADYGPGRVGVASVESRNLINATTMNLVLCGQWLQTSACLHCAKRNHAACPHSTIAHDQNLPVVHISHIYLDRHITHRAYLEHVVDF